MQNIKCQSQNEKLAQQTGLSATAQKPLLLQMLELQLAGGRSGAPINDNNSSPEAAPGVQFSDEKATRVLPLNVGEGLADRKDTDKS